MAARRPKKTKARVRRAAEKALAAIDRRTGDERRGVPRGTRERRSVGPKTAARLARVRIGKDVLFIRKSLEKGDWAEVARVAAGIAGEAGNFLRAAAMLPLGFLGGDLDSLSAGANETDADRPVILLHGWFHNRTGFSVMARRLKKSGRKHVYALDLPTATTTIQRMARILADKIDRICEKTGAKKVDVVAHSLGGLVARWWIHHEGGAARCRHLVTLGAPHKGTALAAFVPIGSGKAVAVGSDVVEALDVPPPPGVRITAIWSDMDYLILPPEDCAWNEAEGNIRVRYVGHMSLLYSQRVFDEVVRALQGDGTEANAKAAAE